MTCHCAACRRALEHLVDCGEHQGLIVRETADSSGVAYADPDKVFLHGMAALLALKARHPAPDEEREP